jgi:signal transduction histidine kinase
MTSADDECQLLALISHELRSPAAVVAGYLRLLRKDEVWAMPERARQMIEEADRSCARILHLVRELSELADLSGRVPGSMSPVPVFPLFDEVVHAAPRVGDGSVTFSYAPEDQQTVVQTEESRMKKAFASLLAAALRERGSEPLEIFGFVSRADSVRRAVIALGDPGIALHREALGDRTASFDCWRGGTGLSVPMACRIVEGAGGCLWALPENSRGAFALGLPVA